MGAQTIDRIAMPSRDVFYRDYVLPRRPVIIMNLFGDHPLAEIRSLDAAREEFGRVVLEIQTEYSTKAADPSSHVRQTMAFDEYLAFAEANPETRVMCTEYPTPSRVSAKFRLPELCTLDARGVDSPEILNIPRRWGDHDLLSNMFLGNRGNYAHTHYDGDHRQVLLYQVFGRKRVVLFQPPSGAKLDVLDAFHPGYSNRYLEHMSDEQRTAFVEFAGGYETILEPGEAVYMPMLIWHYLEYIDTGMSINIRFGRNCYGRFLCIDNFHRDYYIQNVGAKMVDEALVDAKYRAVIEEITAAFVRPSERREKLGAIRALFRRICTQIAPEAEADKHCPPEREEQQLAQIEAELANGLRYTNRAAADRPLGQINGAMTAAQDRVIRDRVRELAYPPRIIEQIIYNRFAKPNIEALTKTEAALLIRTFASPGAVW